MALPPALLQAFIDDSATETGERRLYMAGYLNRTEKWALFGDAWAEELRAVPSIEYFKMAEANGLRGEFGGWSTSARDDKLRGLVRVIRHFEPMSFEIYVSREQLSRLVPLSPRGLANPHFNCTFGVLSIVSRFAAQHGGNVPIDFIFDEQEGVSTDASLFFDEMIRSIPRRARRLINGKPTFGSDKTYYPLQAADMLAWHLRREHETCTSPTTLPIADLLRDGRGHLMSGISEEMLRSWGERFSKIPGIHVAPQSKREWQTFRRELPQLLASGFVPPHGGRWKNALHRAREILARVGWP